MFVFKLVICPVIHDSALLTRPVFIWCWLCFRAGPGPGASCSKQEVQVPVLRVREPTLQWMIESWLPVSFWMGPREVGPQSPNDPFLLCQPTRSPYRKDFLTPSGICWSGWREKRERTGHQVDGCDSAAWGRGYHTRDRSSEWHPASALAAECKGRSLTSHTACHAPTSATASSMLLQVSAFPFPVGTDGLSGTGVSPSDLQWNIGAYLWRIFQHPASIAAGTAPGMVLLPFLLCLQMRTLSNMHVWSLLPFFFFSLLLGSSSGSFLEQYPLAVFLVCLEPLIFPCSVCSGQLGWPSTPQNLVFLNQILVWPCLPPAAQYQCPDAFFPVAQTQNHLFAPLSSCA